MKFLLITQYYKPETGAPQNRLSSLAKNIKAMGHEVEVLTAMPNYPLGKIFSQYQRKFFTSEYIDNIRVFRTWVYTTKRKDIISRIFNYFSFVITSMIKGIFIKKVDYIICESPPLFLSYSAFFLSKVHKAKVIFNVSDLWPESAEKLNIVKNQILLKIAYRLEKKSYEKSLFVNCQTNGIKDNINNRFPNINTYWFPNGVDIDLFNKINIKSNWIKDYGLIGKKLFVYAGILGHAQGLEVIIKSAATFVNDKQVKFIIIGDGPLKNDLKKLNLNLNSNVLFIPNINRETLLSWIPFIYAYIVPLKKIDIFKGAIPSKIFEPLFFKVPILLGVEGEVFDLFIKKNQCGLFFEPENSKDLSDKIRILLKNSTLRNKLGKNGSEFVKKNFDQKKIAYDFINYIKTII